MVAQTGPSAPRGRGGGVRRSIQGVRAEIGDKKVAIDRAAGIECKRCLSALWGDASGGWSRRRRVLVLPAGKPVPTFLATRLRALIWACWPGPGEPWSRVAFRAPSSPERRAPHSAPAPIGPIEKRAFERGFPCLVPLFPLRQRSPPPLGACADDGVLSMAGDAAQELPPGAAFLPFAVA